MKVIIEIDDDLVQAQVTTLTQKKEDRAAREKIKAYLKENDTIKMSESVLEEIDDTLPAAISIMAIGAISKELDI
jgi:Arc/MetJ family transcription regulator